ncbi:MAG TPA: DUF447 domain-containing protein [Candidatus Nanopelagicaceae bacterium]|nr:DUF447 domain-containing protein [Candidatus Nanopelagicaceae bacterium]
MNYLYEVLATTYSLKDNKIVPNTAAMGIRLLENNTIKIWPFPDTTTYKNLDSIKLIILNFVDDIFLYAITSLKGIDISNSIETSSEQYYNYFPFDMKNEYKEIFKRFTQSDSIQLPYLKQAWAIIACVVTNKNLILKQDNFGKSELMEINLSVISYEKFKESFKLFNRAENLTLETIVLATKLNIATEKKDKTLIRTIKRKIEENISEIRRFGKNESAIKAIEHVKNYINRLGP